MSELLEALVTRLEEMAPEEFLEQPDQLAALLAERGELLAAIERENPASLPDDSRAAFKERLVAVLEHERQLITRLEELRAELRKTQERLVTGRAAVRGYAVAGSASSPPPGARRVG